MTRRRGTKKYKAAIVVKLKTVFFLMLLQSLWPSLGMPEFFQLVLWAIYVAEVLVLTCKLFDIRLKTLLQILHFMGRKP